MVGQTQLRDNLEGLIKANSFPRFSILVGPTGSGKKTLASEIGHKLASEVIMAEDVRIESLREIMSMAYKPAPATRVFILPDADTMSVNAKNSMLKITEEPPKDVYFIMTVQNIDNMLDTIRSRAQVFTLEFYTIDELKDFALTDCSMTTDEFKSIRAICEVPGDILEICRYGCKSFIEYVTLVVDNIAVVSGANSFKIADKVALKNEEDKFGLRLFLKAFNDVCFTRIYSKGQLLPNRYEYLKAILVTSDYISQLRTTGINKQMVFDSWLLDIRKVWKIKKSD